jgi:hypothetical protein
MKEEEGTQMTPLDRIACGNHLQILKALIPYMSQNSQFSLAVMTKCMEMKNLIDFFKDSGFLSAQDLSSTESSPTEILTEIAPYFPVSAREQLNQGIQLLEVLSILANMPQGEEQNPEDLFSLFETCQTMFSEQENGKEPE